jgi:primosomal protein N''
MMGKGLRISLVGMGLFFILLGIFLNFQLYTSLTGDSPLHKYSYGIIGIGLDVSKVICLILGVFLLRQATNVLLIAGFISLAFYLVLSLISWAAGWGFTLVVTQHYENKAFQQNTQVQAMQASVDEATAKLQRLSQYANSAAAPQAQSKLDSLQAQLDALWLAPAQNSLGHRTGQNVRSQLGGTCPGTSWYHKKYCAQIQALESQKKSLQTVIDNHATYLAALEHKNAMIKDLGKMELAGANQDSYMHPLFVGMGTVLDISPQLVKYRLLLLTSAMIELLGSLFFVIGIIIQRQTYTVADIVAMEKHKHQILADLGISIIDSGKTEYAILNASVPETGERGSVQGDRFKEIAPSEKELLMSPVDGTNRD